MLVNIKVTGGLNIESGQIDPKATQGLRRTEKKSQSKIGVIIYYYSVFEFLSVKKIYTKTMMA